MFNQNVYNPDVLSCLANLSSDEVFTPPDIVNQTLDELPAEIWESKDIRFLDPAAKSGVFLREIAKRLIVKLEPQIPDFNERIAHIFKNQVFGVATTELTALMSRRSLYCSKHANGKYSVAEEIFSDSSGNIRFDASEHTWKQGKCIHCRASEEIFKRNKLLESYAYDFIHQNQHQQDWYKKMKFDVIIGNPPYQLKDGGTNASAVPIYQKFVTQAKQLNPRFLVMITPSRWFGGGRGLSEFRSEMLNDKRLRKIVDFELASDCFPGVDIAGGVSYFVWEREYNGSCEVESISKGVKTSSKRSLNEFSTFVRHSAAVPIVRKVIEKHQNFMNTQVSSSKPFGLRTYERPLDHGDITLRWQKGEGAYPREKITVGGELIDKWKVITAYVGYDHAGNPDKNGQRRVFSKIDILPPKTVCTETYLVVGAYETEKKCENLVSYMKTKLFRFLVSQFMYSHHITKDAYAFVPILDMENSYDDKFLSEFYELNTDEIDFIESKIKEMN